MIRRIFILVPLLHLYVAGRLLPDMALSTAGWIVGIAWVCVSSALLPAAMFTRRMPDRARADRLAWVGFTAMGFASNLFSLTVLRDIALLFWVGMSLAVDLAEPWASFPEWSAIAAPWIAAFASVAGFISARRLARVYPVEVPIAGLPAALAGFSIAQITDVHVGPTVKRDVVERIVEAVNALNVDAIAITGDIVDGSVAVLAPDVAPMARLRARHGVFCVTGNHEYYSGVHGWIEEFKRLGMQVLLNQHVVLEHEGERLVIAGITDFGAGMFDPEDASDPARALHGAPQNVARVLLAHQPRSCFAAARAGFDLQLSGHTHGGQFIPWKFLVRVQQPFTAGLHRLGTLWVYVCRGAGYWGPPLRLGVSSEIALIKLVQA